MGICFGRRPPKKFVGLWTNGDTVRLRIWESGRIDYKKEVCSASKYSYLSSNNATFNLL